MTTTIQIFSDIHGEAYHNFEWIWNYVKPQANIAVVAGDIHSRNFEDQLCEISKKFKHVVALYGNHEFYHGDISWRADKKKLPKNVHVLDREVWQYRNTVFIGATLWTDFKGMDHLTMHAAKDCINDFRLITAENGRFTPLMASNLYFKDSQFIKMMVEKFRQEGKKIVVVTHFMPSYKCVNEKWKKNIDTDTLNWYFSAQCDDLLNMEGIDLWISGHTHDAYDMNLYGTRVVCNPFGYPGENKFENKVVKI